MPSSRSRSWGEVNRASLAAYLVRARRWAAIAVRITANAPRPSPRYGSCGDPRIWLNIDVSFACAGRAPLAAGDSAMVRAHLEAVEREKLDLYQRRYQEYVQVAKALQSLF